MLCPLLATAVLAPVAEAKLMLCLLSIFWDHFPLLFSFSLSAHAWRHRPLAPLLDITRDYIRKDCRPPNKFRRTSSLGISVLAFRSQLAGSKRKDYKDLK